jgi:NAD-dependent dihydropyrimidine dehydrogenase PreA subunit
VATRHWRQYEEEIHALLSAKADPDAHVAFDVRVPGHRSGINRQIDVYVTGAFAGSVLPNPATLAVDCKCWSAKVDVSDVDRFVGLLEDIGADMGLLITTVGFSKAAQDRAAQARGVHLQVITFDELAEWAPPIVWFCQVCEVDTERHMPGMMYGERLAPGGEPVSERIFVGQCDRCGAVHVMCPCGNITGLHEGQTGEDQVCWSCGRTFFVEPVELDRDAVPVNEDAHERVRFN